MGSFGRYLGQAILYALFFVPLVALTQWPSYRHLAPGHAELKLAIRHAGQIIGECVPVDGAAIAQQAPNMQVPEICPRERSPLSIEMLLDGQSLLQETVSASGLHNDGISSVYYRFTLPAGPHRIELRMNDDVAVDGPTWVLSEDIELAPAQVLSATFKDGFRLQ